MTLRALTMFTVSHAVHTLGAEGLSVLSECTIIHELAHNGHQQIFKYIQSYAV